jgi:amidase
MSTRRANELSAAQAAAAIRAGRLKSIDLVDACLERIGAREQDVGAWQCLDAAQAREQARRCDAEAPRGALHGVPIGIKDIIDTAELPTERGSPIYRGRRASADAACVVLARRAGAVLLGKTVTTEFAYFQPGKTRNPHHLTHTPGGSSSGSAAAVADAMVPLAFGTQTAGSITRPASYCGVVGYKPTFGDWSLVGVKPFAPSLDTLGSFSRSVEDAALMRSVQLGVAFAPLPAALPSLRIGLCRTPWWPAADATTRDGIEALAPRLAGSGRCGVGDAALPPSCDGLVDAQKAIMAREAATSFAFEYDHHRERLSAPLRELIEAGMRLPRDDVLRCLAAAGHARRDIATLFEQHDVLLAPAAPGEAPPGLAATGDPLFSRAWTLLGLPSVALPALRGPSGLPVGVQLIGALGDDERLLQAAHALHAVI